MPIKKPVVISSNPLKLGEANVVSAIPCGKVTQKFVHVKTISEDILNLVDVINKEPLQYIKRQLSKYLIIELISFRDHCRELINLIGQDSALTNINRTVRKRFESTFKAHRIFKDVRNKIGAHRDDDISITSLINCWDSITEGNLNDLLNVSFECLQAIVKSNELIFRPYLLEGKELKGIISTQSSIERKPFAEK